MADESLPFRVDSVLHTVAELLRQQGQGHALEVLEAAETRIEETGYDNWNGGTNLYTLTLVLPVRQFVKVEPDAEKIEQAIGNRLSTVLRAAGGYGVEGVRIHPKIEQAAAARKRPPESEVHHIWDPGRFRLFLSHVAAHKIAVSAVKDEFARLGVSAFVAHEDIEPSAEWQLEIELALRSMNALAALLTPDFHQSKWTDQELGFGLGRGILVVPVRLGVDPYGFIGKQQALSAGLDRPCELASGLVDILLKHGTTGATMREALLVALENSSSFATSKAVTTRLEQVEEWLPAQIHRMSAACKANVQVAEAYGVPTRIAALGKRSRS